METFRCLGPSIVKNINEISSIGGYEKLNDENKKEASESLQTLKTKKKRKRTN